MDNEYYLTPDDKRWVLRKRKTGEVMGVFNGTKAEATLQAVRYALEQKKREAGGPEEEEGTTAPPETGPLL